MAYREVKKLIEEFSKRLQSFLANRVLCMSVIIKESVIQKVSQESLFFKKVTKLYPFKDESLSFKKDIEIKFLKKIFDRQFVIIKDRHKARLARKL